MSPLPSQLTQQPPAIQCHACKGVGITAALSRCASCAGVGGWSQAELLRCGRCAGRMHLEHGKTEDGARELVCMTCGARRYAALTIRMVHQ